MAPHHFSPLLLLLVSFVWAFSFGLIKGRLGALDPALVSAARLGLAMLVFVPFLRLRGLKLSLALSLLAIGSVQFGLMYLAYNASFKLLPAHEVALFTLTTPIFVTLAADALEGKLHWRASVAAIIAVVGAVIVFFKSTDLATNLVGVTLVQLSNLAFALGQVFYRRLRHAHPQLNDRQVFALLYAGGLATTLPLAFHPNHQGSLALNSGQVGTLLYLGVVASGLCFFVWNHASVRVSAGLLAVFNNAKIPLAVACSLVFFGESANLPRLFTGGGLMIAAALLAADTRARSQP